MDVIKKEIIGNYTYEGDNLEIKKDILASEVAVPNNNSNIEPSIIADYPVCEGEEKYSLKKVIVHFKDTSNSKSYYINLDETRLC